MTRVARFHKVPVVLLCLLLVGIVGFADYVVGYERSMLVFYLLPAGLAAWFVGPIFATTLCVASVIVWILGDIAAGARYTSPVVPFWNSAVALTSLLLVVWLVLRLRSVVQDLNERVRQRTAALENEIAIRRKLEQEIAEVTERERQLLGRELHDSLCQHLTATSLAAQVLTGELQSASLPQATAAAKVTELVETGIDLSRNLARGLISLEMAGEGLCGALRELAEQTASRFNIACHCSCDESAVPADSVKPMQLYRIAQEATLNAARHSRGTTIEIRFRHRPGGVELTVGDDGIGCAADSAQASGLGLQIMKHRAALIGATLEVRHGGNGGTLVCCLLAS